MRWVCHLLRGEEDATPAAPAHLLEAARALKWHPAAEAAEGVQLECQAHGICEGGLRRRAGQAEVLGKAALEDKRARLRVEDDDAIQHAAEGNARLPRVRAVARTGAGSKDRARMGWP